MLVVVVGRHVVVVNLFLSSSVENAAPVFRTGDERDEVLAEEPELLSLLVRLTLVCTGLRVVSPLLSQPAGVGEQAGINSVF